MGYNDKNNEEKLDKELDRLQSLLDEKKQELESFKMEKEHLEYDQPTIEEQEIYNNTFNLIHNCQEGTKEALRKAKFMSQRMIELEMKKGDGMHFAGVIQNFLDVEDCAKCTLAFEHLCQEETRKEEIGKAVTSWGQQGEGMKRTKKCMVIEKLTWEKYKDDLYIKSHDNDINHAKLKHKNDHVVQCDNENHIYTVGKLLEKYLSFSDLVAAQMGWQHANYPLHKDEPGPGSIAAFKQCGGDGFGEQIGTLTLSGPVSLVLMQDIQNPDISYWCIVYPGSFWYMRGYARNQMLHMVIPSVPATSKGTECLYVKSLMTETDPNNFVKCDCRKTITYRFGNDIKARNKFWSLCWNESNGVGNPVEFIAFKKRAAVTSTMGGTSSTTTTSSSSSSSSRRITTSTSTTTTTTATSNELHLGQINVALQEESTTTRTNGSIHYYTITDLQTNEEVMIPSTSVLQVQNVDKNFKFGDIVYACRDNEFVFYEAMVASDQREQSDTVNVRFYTVKTSTGLLPEKKITKVDKTKVFSIEEKKYLM